MPGAGVSRTGVVATIALAAGLALAPIATGQPADDPAPLHRAAHAGDLAVVEHLLSSGADPDAVTRLGVTPLAFAAGGGRAAVVGALVKLLKDLGNRVDAVDDNGDGAPARARRHVAYGARAAALTGTVPCPSPPFHRTARCPRGSASWPGGACRSPRRC